MTTLEIILILVLWIGYGIYSIKATKNASSYKLNDMMPMLVLFAPFILIYKMFVGVFMSYDYNLKPYIENKTSVPEPIKPPVSKQTIKPGIQNEITILPDEAKIRVHRGHCCIHHGCKYGDEDCPVVNQSVKQYPGICQDCDDDKIDLHD